jgi:2-methylcitrate dehydratase PrpD
MGVTENLCNRIVGTGYDDLTEAACAAARRLVLDGLAVAVAGSKQEASPGILADHLREMGGVEAASSIGFGFRTSPVNAAYINGVSMHVLDFEPMWNPANHQLSTTLPAALALAEARGMDGRAVLTALVKGIEMQGWIRQSSRQFEARQARFHPPSQVGPMGAAVAAAHMLGLDVLGLRNALGIASSRTGGLLANAGTMTKSTNCGVAVASGLDAAMLAARGFTGNPDIFEAPQGYVDGVFDEGFVLEDLLNYGPPFRVVEPGYAIKMFPSQYGTHFAITAALELHGKIEDPAAVETVEVVTPQMFYIDRPRPATGLAGKFSWQYVTAAALLDGRVTMSSFEDERRFAADMEAMLGRIKVDMRADIPARFDQMYVETTVRLKNGTAVTARCDGPRGKWGGTPISDEDHLVKVRDCLAVRLEDANAEQVVALASRVDDLDAGDIKQLMSVVSQP